MSVNRARFDCDARSGNTIPLSVPEIGFAEREAVAACIASGWVSTAGPHVEEFEKALVEVTGAKHCVAVINGTSALHLALLCIGVGPGDEVIVPALTFIAPANAARYVGAQPVFMDVEPDYWQLDVGLLEEFLSSRCTPADPGVRNRATARRVAAIVAVHTLGHPVDLQPLTRLADRYGVPLLEDAAESIGTLYRGGHVGAFGAAGCLSFNGNKTITAGNGGAILTNDARIAERARYLSTQAKDDPIRYEHGAVGYNYRLSSVNAAIGTAQLRRLADFVSRKRAIASCYASELESTGVRFQSEAEGALATFWLSTFLLPEGAGLTPDRVISQLAAGGFQARPPWQPLHHAVPYVGCEYHGGEVAEALASRAVSLPSSVGLTDVQQERVVSKLRELLSG